MYGKSGGKGSAKARRPGKKGREKREPSYQPEWGGSSTDKRGQKKKHSGPKSKKNISTGKKKVSERKPSRGGGEKIYITIKGFKIQKGGGKIFIRGNSKTTTGGGRCPTFEKCSSSGRPLCTYRKKRARFEGTWEKRNFREKPVKLPLQKKKKKGEKDNGFYGTQIRSEVGNHWRGKKKKKKHLIPQKKERGDPQIPNFWRGDFLLPQGGGEKKLYS